MLAGDSLRAGRLENTAVSLDSLIPADHIIRRIDAAVDWESRCAPMRGCYSAERGRPAFEPEILLAIALLRHIYHLDSLRTAAAEIQTNLVYRWFIGCPLGESIPHFSTVSGNLLHRIPKEIFEKAFADALCDIIDAGVMTADALLYPSVFLTEEGELYTLCGKYFSAFDQLTLAIPEERAAAEESMPTEQLRIQ